MVLPCADSDIAEQGTMPSAIYMNLQLKNWGSAK